MRISEVITELGKDFEKEFSISREPLYSKYKTVYEHFAGEGVKGVLLIGSIGCGKTTMMRVIQRLFKDTEKKFRWITSRDLKLMLDERRPVSEIMDLYGRSLKMDLYIDDIGIDKTKNDYGNCINLISELIFEREELFSIHGHRTHFSSNIPPTMEDVSLENVYGKRAYDRLVGMCELISWQSKSLRRNGLN